MNPGFFARAIATIALITTTIALRAQDGFDTGSDDITTLSPFEVGSASTRGYDPRYRGGNLAKVPVRLITRADTVILELTISSDDKKPDKRIADLQAAFRILRDNAAKRNDILMKSGYVELPLVTSNRWGFSSAKTGDEVSSFNVTLITRIGPKETVFERMAVLNQFIDDLDLRGNAKVLYVSSGIALVKPDQYRKELLQLIAKEVDLMKSVFGPTIEFQIRGLDEKVQVRQLDEVNLELSLPYQLVLSSKGS